MKPAYCVIDIETIPNQYLPEDCLPKPDMTQVKYGNTKNSFDRMRIEQEFVEKFNADLSKKMSLDPYLNQIVVAVGLDSRDGKFFERVAGTQDQEFEMLSALWSWLRQRYLEGMPIVGFNSSSFDFPTLIIRSVLLDIYVAPDMVHALNERQERNIHHYDLMQRWPLAYRNPFSGQLLMKGLNHQLKRFGLPGKLDGMDGSMVYPAFQEGRLDDIITYCRDGDVRGTAALFERVAPWMVTPKSRAFEEAELQKERA